MKKRIGVFDLDGTLVKRSGRGWFGEKILRLIEKPNREMITKIKDYDVVIILTGRNKAYRELTEQQLKRFGVKFDKLIMHPELDRILDWKREQIEKLKREGEVEWFDDDIKGI